MYHGIHRVRHIRHYIIFKRKVKKERSQYLNHLYEVKFLHISLSFDLFLIVLTARQMPGKWDLLKVGGLCNQS